MQVVQAGIWVVNIIMTRMFLIMKILLPGYTISLQWSKVDIAIPTIFIVYQVNG